MFPMPDLVVPDIPDISQVPTQDDLPCDDGFSITTFRHTQQINLLHNGLANWLDRRNDGFAGGDMFLYYSMPQVLRKELVHLDFLVPARSGVGMRNMALRAIP